MGVVKIPARNLIFQVQAADGVTWLQVGGLNELQIDPGANSAKQDVTTFDSAGAYEERIMQRGLMLTLSGFRLQDSATAAQDAGQARLDYLGLQVAEASLGAMRYRYGTTDTTWKVIGGTVDPSAVGGKVNDESSWGTKITRSGATTTASAP